MALMVWLTVFGPALWAGLLLSRIFQSIMALVLPNILSPDQLLWLDAMTPGLMVFGLVLATVGNLMVALETGFVNLKKLWVDNLLVYMGAAAWLLAALLQAEWWLPLAGQGIAALLMAPQLCLTIGRVAIRGDAFFAALLKLLAIILALFGLTATIGWLGL